MFVSLDKWKITCTANNT